MQTWISRNFWQFTSQHNQQQPCMLFHLALHNSMCPSASNNQQNRIFPNSLYFHLLLMQIYSTVLDVYGSPQSHTSTLDLSQSLVWLGCDDGLLYIISASKGRQPFVGPYLTLNCDHPVLSIVHMEGRVYIALNKRRILIYHRNTGKSLTQMQD